MRHFGVTILENLQPRWNVAPAQNSLVIHQTGLHIEAKQAKWGLPPASSKQSFLINARMETVAEKPTFREAFAVSRALIPATGWYEWSAPKQPWHIQLRDGGPMAMAGLLFERPTHPQTHFVIITSPAEGALQSIHHRQPLIVPKQSWQDWLTGSTSIAQQILISAPASLFNWYRVAADVGKVAHDHPGLVTPLNEEALAAEEARAAEEAASKPTDRSTGLQGNLFS